MEGLGVRLLKITIFVQQFLKDLQNEQEGTTFGKREVRILHFAQIFLNSFTGKI